MHKLPGCAAVISTGGFFTDEFGAFVVVQHGQELATCGEASAIHQRVYASAKMWLCRLLQAEVWMFHHTKFPVCRRLHIVARDSLGLGVVSEKIEFSTIAEQLFVVIKWIIPQIRKQLLAGCVQAAVIIAHINSWSLCSLSANLSKGLLKEFGKGEFARGICIFVPMTNRQYGNFPFIEELDLRIRGGVWFVSLPNCVLPIEWQAR